MLFKESIENVYKSMENLHWNTMVRGNIIFKCSDAFKYICINIEDIIGQNTNDNIVITGVDFHNHHTPMIRCVTDNISLEKSTCIIGHVVYLPIPDMYDPFYFFWHLAHEMVHAFLSIKDNNILSSYDTPNVLEEGVATLISNLLYRKYFTENNIPFIDIQNNDYAYDYAENLYFKIIIDNENDIRCIKKIRKYNPSLKILNKEDFIDINIDKNLVEDCISDFQSRFNRVPGTY